MDINETLRDAQYKDASPVKTVEKILGILQENGIETEEFWFESNVPYCHALRISIPGTSFSVNGKGLTREFARASGYGELMERLQLGFTGAPGMQKDGSYSFDETKYPPISRDRLQGQRYEKLAQRLAAFTGIQLTPQELLKQFTTEQDTVPCVPCYNITTASADYFPNDIRLQVYGSNGCAAGNSIAEAIVQALSEIVERHHQNHILLNDLTPPNVPEKVLQASKTAYDIIRYVRSQGYQVIIKDCSLGEKFPVVCACFIQESTGKYHTHFGAYPIFEIALERALTETFQGRNINSFAKFADLTYQAADSTSLTNVVNEFTYGAWTKSPAFFVGTPSYPYNDQTGFVGEGNNALLTECIDYFKSMGHEILVCNSATLGFPTCQVLVPGYSEIFINRLHKKTSDHKYYRYSVNTLRCPSAASIQDKLGMLMHLEQMDKIANRVRHMHGFLNNARLSADLTDHEESMLMTGTLGYVYYDLGRYSDVVKCVDQLIAGADEVQLPHLIALKRYLTLRLLKKDEDLIRRTMELFHDPHVVADIYAKGNPMDRYTLHCDLSCPKECQLYGKCHNKRVTELDNLINNKIRNLNHDAFVSQLDALLH